jgi:hypothetical protein
MRIVLTCVECKSEGRASFEGGRIDPSSLYQDLGWILSLINPAALVVAPVCAACAEKIYPEQLRMRAKSEFERFKG